MLWNSRNSIFALLFLVKVPFGLCEEQTIFRDVAIVGGGASGTFAAIKLRAAGQSVILIEKEAVLGGHTNTYRDPKTGITVDYGVQVFHDEQIVKDYFNQLNVSWTISTSVFGSSNPKHLDPKTAKSMPYTSPDPTAALAAYAAQLSKYPGIERGFFLPDPIPDDLLLPFGQFLQKYPDILNATYTAFTFGQGLGDFLNQPTLYVFKNFGTDIIKALSTGFLVTTKQNNYEIYSRATKILGSDVLLNSEVMDTPRRDGDGIQLTIQTPNGNRKVIATKLLLAIPPKIENLARFALDTRESTLFNQFTNTGYYTSLVNNTGLPPNFTSYSTSPHTTQNVPILPGIYNIVPTALDGVFDIKYGSPTGLSDDFVKSEIIAYVRALQANGFAAKTQGDPTFVAFNSHTPFELTVSTDQISKGFYKKLYALQGYRNTWYTGAAFHTQDSSMLWDYTSSYVLPPLLA